MRPAEVEEEEDPHRFWRSNIFLSPTWLFTSSVISLFLKRFGLPIGTLKWNLSHINWFKVCNQSINQRTNRPTLLSLSLSIMNRMLEKYSTICRAVSQQKKDFFLSKEVSYMIMGLMGDARAVVSLDRKRYWRLNFPAQRLLYSLADSIFLSFLFVWRKTVDRSGAIACSALQRIRKSEGGRLQFRHHCPGNCLSQRTLLPRNWIRRQ